MNGEESVYASNVQYLIVSNDTVLNEVFQSQKKAYDDYDYTSAIYYEMDFNLDGTDAEKLDCYKQLTDSSISGVFHSRQDMSASFYSTFGGFLFLGLFLGLLFLLATVLIIYYKQISEGFEDQRRFEIMRKVGMTEKEVRRSIQGQILLVFFLPLVMAAIHIFAAFNMITRLISCICLDQCRPILPMHCRYTSDLRYYLHARLLGHRQNILQNCAGTSLTFLPVQL